MKKILLFLSLLACVNVVYAVSPNCELYIINFVTDTNLYVRFYPTGAIYHKEISVTNTIERYTIRSQSFEPGNGTKIGIKRIGELSLNNRLKYIVGIDGFALNNRSPYPGYFEIKPDLTGISYDKWLLLGNDASANSDLDGLFGFGEYILEIYKTTDGGTSFQQIIQIPIDWLDFNYPYGTGVGAADLFLRIYDISPLNITFEWSAGVQGDELPLFGTGSPPYNGGIQVYKQYHRFDSNLYEWVGYNLNNENPPSRGNSISDEYFLTYPMEGRNLPSPYNIPQHSDAGLIRANVSIDTNVNTPLTLLQSPTNLTIANKAIVKVEPADTLNLITPSSPVNGYVNLIIQDSSFLAVRPSAKIIVHSPNRITLKNTGSIVINTGGEIRIKPGALFCNEGGKLFGRVTFENGFHQPLCSQLADFFMQDSSKFVLDSNAVLPIQNNTTLHIRGNQSALILNPGSKLLFGENSGIICDSGARIVANNAEFASIDSTKKWNGISLNDLSHDTIKNCVIKNAMYGIAINDKHTDEEELEEIYSTEISNCSFINQTNYALNNAVYAEGSSQILFKNNTIHSNSLTKGFTHGVYAEYCPAGNFNIIGNTILNSGAGMTLISCSPFVAQNNLEGNAYSESGIFADNVNGKFEHNIINDFYYAYYSFTSSPDLLKNTFGSDYDDVVYLSHSSVPMMKPVLSGSDLYWYSGDNTITGSPSDAGILFDEDSYPNMNYGYNRITLTGNTYYITGINPSSGARYFDVYQNYWGGTPDSSKFYVYNSDGVRFNPYDSDSPAPRETSNFTLIDIGFGLYDTIHYYESDNPGLAEELYLNGMRNENEGNYTLAINRFKEIIEDHRVSEFTSLCLSRIYNCHEKKRATQSEYNLLENYYGNIFTDTTYNLTQRNISEEFMLKTIIKQNNIVEAISNYNNIYSQNTNTSKGTHALINREILSAGSGDNAGNLSQIENIEIKQTRINTILSNIIKRNKIVFESITRKPVGFQLHQNYPNPFNPSTKISFTISKGSFVTLKVYDITGREVKTLINEYKQSGSYETEFDASLSARQGNAMPSGVYYYKLEADGISEIKKMILVK